MFKYEQKSQSVVMRKNAKERIEVQVMDSYSFYGYFESESWTILRVRLKGQIDGRILKRMDADAVFLQNGRFNG